jgi:hypothetical protein
MSFSTRILISIFLFVFFFSACSTDLPVEHHSHFSFPKHEAYVELPNGAHEGQPYETLGWVRAKAEYPTLEQIPNDPALCLNYYNKAVRNLLKEAKKVNGDAVIEIRSVIMFMDGTFEEKKTPECSDDGQEGEILLKGIAIKYKPFPSPSPSASPSPMH